MRKATRTRVSVAATLCLTLGLGLQAASSTYAQVVEPAQKGPAMPTRARGTFDVKMAPQTPQDAAIGRMSLDKQFHGDLEATSQGEMLAAMTAVQGSAGYVALEKVTGKLNGKSGTFVLQHTGTMTRGTPALSITVVPDSGTGDLAGLAGTMTIDIAEGKHSYTFEYTLADAR